MELECKKRPETGLKVDSKKISILENWFRYDYNVRLNTIARYQYLGLTPPESRYSLEMEAYEKENELRKLKGLEELPAPKNKILL